MMTPHDYTIAAIATPPGHGGVGIVRVSGSKAILVAQALTQHALKPRHAYFGEIRSPDGQPLDQGITLYFQGPASFTGEDVVEFQIHGGPVILDLLLRQVLDLGCRLARPGEFSERAFLNDKIDLIQAEAIADLIQASSAQAARQAMESLRGRFSDEVHQLCDALQRLRIHVEACLDFPDEDVDLLADGAVSERLRLIHAHLDRVSAAAQSGVLINEGLDVVILGKPNVGKSSLLNALAGDERALVTAIPGTTRDVIREQITIGGLHIHLKDTAGLRDTDDPVEQLGIGKAMASAAGARAILLMLDASLSQGPVNLDQLLADLGVTEEMKGKPCLVILNKIDLTDASPGLDNSGPFPILRMSTQHQSGLDALKTWLHQQAGHMAFGDGAFTARRRHLDAIRRASDHLHIAQQALADGRTPELVAEDLRQAQQALEHITGRIMPDDLLGEIFSSFCIGK